MPSKIAYPWFYFYRILRLSLLLLLVSLTALVFYLRTNYQQAIGNTEWFDSVLIYQALPLIFFIYFIFLILFYRSTRPLGSVLAKVQKYKADIPLEKTLRHFYRKDEWMQIEEALNKADKRLQDQMLQVQNENEKIGAMMSS